MAFRVASVVPESLRKALRGLKSGRDSAGEGSVRVFEELVDMAKNIAVIDPKGLHAFVVAILRPLQSQHIIAAAERAQHAAPPSIDDWSFFMGSDVRGVFDFGALQALDAGDFEVDLAKDVTLPTMWHRQSVASAFGAIGAGLKCGSWRQDPNHSVALWLPWRIAFVNNGNHSIAAGVIRAEGKLKPSSVFNLEPQLREIRCDGRNFIRVADGTVVAPIHDARLAAVWEIGRLMCGLG